MGGKKVLSWRLVNLQQGRESRNAYTHRSLLNDNVLDDQLLDGEVLGLGVSLSVLEKVEDDLHRLDRPSTCDTKDESRC